MKQKTYSKLGLVFLGSSMIAAAGPIPFTTDDTSARALNQGEVSLSTSHSNDASGWTGTVPALRVEYGVLPDVEVSVTGAFNYIKLEHTASTTGYGDTTLAAKYNFIHEAGLVPSVAFAPSYTIPTGNDKDGLGAGHNNVYLPLLLEKTFGGYVVDVNGGVAINQGAGVKDWQYVGVSVQKQLTETFSVGAELYNRSAVSNTQGSDFAYNLGFGAQLAKGQSLYLTAGSSISGPTDYQAALTYKFVFGN
jgi:hypothetical protein